MIDTLDMFGQGGKSKESVIPTDLDSIRATLFGKFYEGIIAKWLEEKEGYIHLRGRACVYWKCIEEFLNPSKDSLPESERTIINIDSLNKSLKQKKENNTRANLDGLFEKADVLYLWEAKNWPKWDEGKPLKKQVEDILKRSPWLLTKVVKHDGKYKPIGGILFSWWQKFEGWERLQEDISRIINLPFIFYFTSEIIDDCRQKRYEWYKKLINEQKKNIDNFFRELLGEK